MERLNYQAFLALSSEYSVALCGPQGAEAYLENVRYITEVPPNPLSRFLIACQWQSLVLARRVKPELIYSGSGVTAPAALMAASVVKARSVCFLHGLDIVADHPVYKALFLPAIRRMDGILVNSAHTASLAEDAGISSQRIHIVHPGVSLPPISERTTANWRFRQRLGLSNQPILLAAGRLTQRKGIAEFIRHALPEICNNIPDLVFLVIGDEPKNALNHRAGVEIGIRDAIHNSKMDSHVKLLGSVDDASLSDAYFSANALVFPVLDLPGDVEGFGMVAVEAAAHGLPTVAFAVGGVPDAVADGRSGWLVSPGDYSLMAERLVSLLRSEGNAEMSSFSRRHAEEFSWERFGMRLRSAVR